MQAEQSIIYSNSAYYLKLSHPLKFEAVSRARLNNVFYDEGNNQVFCVQSGCIDVVVKCPGQDVARIFQIQDKGPVISIKFNPAQNILAIQRKECSVVFINFSDGKQSAEYTQYCKSKSVNLIGFIWTSASEICFITDKGVEMYQVEQAKPGIKHVKTMSMTINWFLFSRHTGILLLSAGGSGTALQPLAFSQGTIHKLTRFEVDPVSVPKAQKLGVEERDTMLGTLYRQPRVLVLRHQSQNNVQGAEVVIYTIEKMSTVKKTHVLKLGKTGRFAMSIVDNLVFVHHQASKTSLMFDIALEAEFDGSVYYHCPVMPPQPIKEEDGIEFYSSNWIMFPLSTIIDIKMGCLWTQELELAHIPHLIHSKSLLIEFLMLRENSKNIIFEVLQEMTQNMDQNLEELASVFDKINAVYKNRLLTTMKWELASPVSPADSQTSDTSRVVIDQLDMYTNVLSKLADYVSENSLPRQKKWAGWVLLEYVRSLTDHQLPAQHYLHELVINSLVLHKSYYQLHQLLQYYVVSDSKPLACLLLSLQNLYPAAHQLALDMLQRLSNAEQEIMEVLLSKQEILSALRYSIETENENQLSERKFTEVSQATGNKHVFYAVAAYFQTRNANLNGAVLSFK